MEDPLMGIFENETLQDSSFTADSHLLIRGPSCGIGITASAILIAAISINKSLQNRTSAIILCFSILNIIYLSVTLALYTPSMEYHKLFGCMLYNADLTAELFKTIAMLMLASNWLILTTRYKDKMIIASFVVAFIIITIISLSTCSLDVNLRHIFYMSEALLILPLLGIFVCKDIYRCCKTKSNSINKEENFRLNVARLYIYIMVLQNIVFDPIHWGAFGISLYASQYVVSGFILFYVYRSRHSYRIGILNVFRRKENRYNVDATVDFTVERNNHEDGNVGTNINA